MKFRNLKSEEIECRISTVKEKGFSLLLYKDARCDMNILDETVTPLGWQREHVRDNQNCIVSIWDKEKNEWIKKEDTGTESNAEKQKGLASDSFKRACVNWGIGRELYTSPFIWINANNNEVIKRGDKFTTYEKFKVSHVAYINGVISELNIVDKLNKNRFSLKKEAIKDPKKPEPKVKEELTPESPRWDKAINSIIEEKTTIEKIKKSMVLSKENETLLARETTK